jgi:hypothetical protein
MCRACRIWCIPKERSLLRAEAFFNTCSSGRPNDNLPNEDMTAIVGGGIPPFSLSGIITALSLQYGLTTTIPLHLSLPPDGGFLSTSEAT